MLIFVCYIMLKATAPLGQALDTKTRAMGPSLLLRWAPSTPGVCYACRACVSQIHSVACRLYLVRELWKPSTSRSASCHAPSHTNACGLSIAISAPACHSSYGCGPLQLRLGQLNLVEQREGGSTSHQVVYRLALAS